MRRELGVGDGPTGFRKMRESKRAASTGPTDPHVHLRNILLEQLRGKAYPLRRWRGRPFGCGREARQPMMSLHPTRRRHGPWGLRSPGSPHWIAASAQPVGSTEPMGSAE